MTNRLLRDEAWYGAVHGMHINALCVDRPARFKVLCIISIYKQDVRMCEFELWHRGNQSNLKPAFLTGSQSRRRDKYL